MTPGWILLALLATQQRAPAPLAGEGRLEGWMQSLDAAHEPEWTQALEHLRALGAPAATRALTDFERLDFTARRARAQLLARVPAAECAPRVLVLTADPDPEVRRLLAEWLGNPALAETLAQERVDALESLAREDPDERVRSSARAALAECALEEAVPALDRLLERLPAEEAEAAARALAQLPLGRARLIARLAGSGRTPSAATNSGTPLSDAVHAALLTGYGRALAEVPGGGDELRERLPFLCARTDPSLALQLAARAALATFVARAAELSESARAMRVLEALGREGWPPVECLRRRLDLAWHDLGDPAQALELSHALERTAQSLEPAEAESWELRASLFTGAALTALDRRAEASVLFDGLAERLEGLLTRRSDLFPAPGAPRWTEAGGALTIDQLHLLGLVHLWRALLRLEEQPGDRAVGVELRAAHVCFLRSRLVAQLTLAPDPSTLDSMLERDLSPYTLLLFNEKLPPEQRGPGLDRALALAEVWGRVAPLEMQGLTEDPPRDGELGDLFHDPERLGLLKAMREAEMRDLQLRLDELGRLESSDPAERDNLKQRVLQRGAMLVKAKNEERAELEKKGTELRSSNELGTLYAQLLEYLSPSMHALTLAGELRADGRSAEARALCERALATLRTAPLGSSTWSELSSARFELLLGSTLMDESKPGEAEKVLLDSEKRLEAIEALVGEWRQGGGDPAAVQNYLTQIRTLRGDALLSLAVNANVRLRDPARALAYFERAYELNQSPFMRVLRACYRARSGKADEARTVLASVVPVPSLYYNIACTHALLGEKDAALDYLERDFRANAPTPGSRNQKREWTRKDPDLANLRGEPRFERMLEAR